MKKFLLILLAVIGFGTGIVLCGSSISFAKTEAANCDVSIYNSSGDIAYSNTCSSDQKVWIEYQTRTSTNGGWSDWSAKKTMNRTLEARSSGYIAEGTSGIQFRKTNWGFR